MSICHTNLTMPVSSMNPFSLLLDGKSSFSLFSISFSPCLSLCSSLSLSLYPLLRVCLSAHVITGIIGPNKSLNVQITWTWQWWSANERRDAKSCKKNQCELSLSHQIVTSFNMHIRGSWFEVEIYVFKQVLVFVCHIIHLKREISVFFRVSTVFFPHSLCKCMQMWHFE